MVDLNLKAPHISNISPLKIVVTGDIHINTNRFREFELKRLSYLQKNINKQKPDLVILNGDILDKAKPTLQDLQLFYKFTSGIKSTIFLIAGNHEELSIRETCYDFIPEVNYTYITTGKLEYKDWKLLFVSHNHLNDIKKLKGDILFTHYRSAVNIHTTDEYNNKLVSEKFKITFLSDIHQKMNPYMNILYTSSPNSLKFNKEVDTYGFYVITLNDDINYDYQILNKYSKQRLIVSATNIEDVKAVLNKHNSWLFKLSLSDSDLKDEFKDYDNIVGVDLLSVDEYDEKEDYKQAVENIFNKQKLNPYDILVGYLPLQDYSEKVQKDVLIDIKQGLLK